MPVPAHEFMQAVLRYVGDAGKDAGGPDLRPDVGETGGADPAVPDGGPLGDTVEAREQPRRAAEGDAARRPFCRIVGEVNAAIAEEAADTLAMDLALDAEPRLDAGEGLEGAR